VRVGARRRRACPATPPAPAARGGARGIRQRPPCARVCTCARAWCAAGHAQEMRRGTSEAGACEERERDRRGARGGGSAARRKRPGRAKGEVAPPPPRRRAGAPAAAAVGTGRGAACACARAGRAGGARARRRAAAPPSPARTRATHLTDQQTSLVLFNVRTQAWRNAVAPAAFGLSERDWRREAARRRVAISRARAPRARARASPIARARRPASARSNARGRQGAARLWRSKSARARTGVVACLQILGSRSSLITR
jgi:hypothetical protein